MIRLSLVELQILASLLEGKTLSEIAEQLYLAQPTVSKALQTAERTANFGLVEHQGRRVRLTPAGAELAKAAQVVIAQLHEFNLLLEDMQVGKGAPVRIVTTGTPGNYILPVVVAEFLRSFREAQVALRVVPHPDVWDLFEKGGYDLCVGPWRYSGSHSGGSLAPILDSTPYGWLVEPLYNDRLAFFVAPDSQLSNQAQVDWSDISDEPLIGPFTEVYFAQIWEKLGREGFAPSQRIELPAVEGVKRMVEAGGGVGVLFEAAVRRELTEGRLKRLDLRAPTLSLSYCLARRATLRTLPVVKQFCSFLVARVRSIYDPLE